MPDFTNRICRPDLSDWPTLLKKNQSQLSTIEPQLRRQFRQRLIRDAKAYTLNTLGYDPELPPERLTPDTPLIMTGHQPVIYHHGILEKNRIVSQVCNSEKYLGINVIIDTDEGDGGRLYYPECSHEFILVGDVSLSQSTGLYMFQAVKDSEEVDAVFRMIETQVKTLGYDSIVNSLSRIAAHYRNQPNAPITEANTRLRLHFGPHTSLYEIPLSQIICWPESQQFYLSIFNDSLRFFETYNEALVSYRKLRGIKNEVNPFPNLKSTGEVYELPFWVIDTQKQYRDVLQVSRDRDGIRFYSGSEVLCKLKFSELSDLYTRLTLNKRIAPRGAAITLLLKYLGSDFFVHGLGGEKYDGFTDLLAERFFNWSPVAWGVVSRDEYLFQTELERLSEFDALDGLIKQISETPDYYSPTPFVDVSVQTELKAMNQLKFILIREMERPNLFKKERASIGRQIKIINNDMKEMVNTRVKERWFPGWNGKNLPYLRNIFHFRKFPFFYF